MKLGEVYKYALTGKHYEVHTINPVFGSATAVNIDNKADFTTILPLDITNGFYILQTPPVLLPGSQDHYQAGCNEFNHLWREELNFQFADHYCSRCGIKKPSK